VGEFFRMKRDELPIKEDIMNPTQSLRVRPPNRRQFLQRMGGLGLSATGLALTESRPAKAATPRVGFLSVPPSGSSPVFEAFQAGLHELGYAKDQNIGIEWRGAEGKDEQLPKLAAELISLGVDAIVAETYPAIVAAKQVTSTVPIIMAVSSDPIATGLVASLSRPGGNVTGLTTLSTDLNGKRLQMLKEAVPGISCVALVWASLVAPDKEPGLREAQRAAHALGLQVQYIEIRKSEDWEAAAMAVFNTRPKPDAVFQLCDPVTLSRRKALVDFAARSWLPSMYEMKEYVLEGGLMAYGPSLAAMGHRSAYFVDRILKGAKPADLPVEQPTKFELVIDLKTAKEIGLDLPPPLLGRADEVIE
jgi:putative tryptophan/tyrosine transport system substrate-binding protein